MGQFNKQQRKEEFERIRDQYLALRQRPEDWQDYLLESQELQDISGYELRGEPPYETLEELGNRDDHVSN